MQCPHCNEALLISDRQGIEIDHCPKCRGVWLDRGELDKIIERAARYESGRDHDDDDDDDDERRRRQQPYPQQGYQQGYPPPPPQQGYPQQGYGHPYPYKKKKSFWSELFD